MSLELVFITSSKIKLEHAKYLCKDYDINISSYKKLHYGIGYDEPRIYDRLQLLKESYEDALKRWKKYTKNEDKMFILEDTSVIIEALSTEEKEVPGLDIKYWMAENTFEALDTQLKSKGNNRNCIVRSDVILHLSKDLQNKLGKSFLHFTSSVKGRIVENEFDFDTNLMYPWLDNKTFNKWFIPDGGNTPISMLDIKDADKYDFRKIAFEKMCELLNTNKEISVSNHIQSKFSYENLYILCGPTCAGKSTLAQYLVDNYGYFHIEASDFMWLKYYQKHDTKMNVSIGDFAKKALEENPQIVTNQIIDFIKENKLTKIVISGFRSDKELESIRKWNDEYCFYKYAIYIDASIESRFDRELKRNREDKTTNFDSFVAKDEQQFSMGLNEIKDNISSKLINEKTVKEFFNEFENNHINIDMEIITINTERRFESIGLEIAILFALYKYKEDSYTTTQISKIINSEIVKKDNPKHKDNISRYFNQQYYPYYDIIYDDIRNVNKYKINYTGISKLKSLI